MQDINQLKLILEAVGQTTDSAKWVFISWLVADIIKIVIGWSCSIAIITIATRCVIKMIAIHLFGGFCRDMVVPNQAGTTISNSEREKVKEAILAGLAAQKKNS